MQQDAQGWGTGMTLRDGVGGRWEGGSGWEHTYTMADSCQCMEQPPQYCN